MFRDLRTKTTPTYETMNCTKCGIELNRRYKVNICPSCKYNERYGKSDNMNAYSPTDYEYKCLQEGFGADTEKYWIGWEEHIDGKREFCAHCKRKITNNSFFKFCGRVCRIEYHKTIEMLK